MAADCIVTPRALSAGRKSVTVEPSSTSVEFVRLRTQQTLSLQAFNQIVYEQDACSGKETHRAINPGDDKQRNRRTSYSSGMPAIVEHALCSGRLALVSCEYHSNGAVFNSRHTASIWAMMPIFLVLDKSAETSKAFVCKVTPEARLVL